MSLIWQWNNLIQPRLNIQNLIAKSMNVKIYGYVIHQRQAWSQMGQNGVEMSWMKPTFPSHSLRRNLNRSNGYIVICIMNYGIKFCDEDGYGVVPIRIIIVIPTMQEERLPNDLIHLRKGGDPLLVRGKEIQL